MLGTYCVCEEVGVAGAELVTLYTRGMTFDFSSLIAP